MATNNHAPVYRLFFSVDLKGSTAFKYSYPKLSTSSTLEREDWKKILIEGFYKKFTEVISSNFYNSVENKMSLKLTHSLEKVKPIEFIKAIGDELLFSAEIKSFTEAQFYTSIFINTLWNVRKTIDHINEIDLKPTAWLGLIHATDVEIQNEAIFRIKAPNDFIGPSIDTGFRLTNYSTTGKMMLSIDLAYALAMAGKSNDLINGVKLQFGYDGRMELKGVKTKHGYPLVWLDVYKGYRIEYKDTLNYKGEEQLYSPFTGKKILSFVKDYINKSSDVIVFRKELLE